MSYSVIPYIIFGIKLFAVARSDGIISCYCETSDDAKEKCNQLNRLLNL